MTPRDRQTGKPCHSRRYSLPHCNNFTGVVSSNRPYAIAFGAEVFALFGVLVHNFAAYYADLA